MILLLTFINTHYYKYYFQNSSEDGHDLRIIVNITRAFGALIPPSHLYTSTINSQTNCKSVVGHHNYVLHRFTRAWVDS